MGLLKNECKVSCGLCSILLTIPTSLLLNDISIFVYRVTAIISHKKLFRANVHDALGMWLYHDSNSSCGFSLKTWKMSSS
jgi:hypothetical protein